MTIQECYARLGGNYEEVCARLPSEALVRRFALKFLQDDSFATLCAAFAAGDRAAAFAAAHTLKGAVANLSFTRLYTAASALTEALRPAADQIPAAAGPLFEQVRQVYADTTAALRAFEAYQG